MCGKGQKQRLFEASAHGQEVTKVENRYSF
jgi:hypothetical protein